MVSLAQNRQLIWYAELGEVVDVLDEDGYKTGEKEKSYTTPQSFLIYVAPARGEATWGAFGIGDNYTNVMSTCDKTCPITEDSVLWVGTSPYNDDGTRNDVEHNYIVTKVARGLNSILYGIKKVEVS